MAYGTFLQQTPGTQVSGAAATSSFREWIRNTQGAFSSCSWINTNPSGAIDPDGPNTFSRIAANFSSGYDVFRMDDELTGGGSGSFPIFVRVDYATSNATNGSGSQYIITIGRTHNNSGTLGPPGRVSVFRTHTTTFSAANTSSVSYYSGNSASIAIVTFTSDSTNGLGFYIERTRDVNGNVTAEGVIASNFAANAGTDSNVIFYPNSFTGSIVNYIGLISLLGNASPSTVQGRRNISHFYHFGGNNAILNPGILLLGAKAGDVPVNGAIIETNVYGSMLNYVNLGNQLTAAGGSSIRTSTSNNRLLLLAE